MNAATSSLAHAASDVETRIFRRGVSDQEVRQAIELVREYVATQRNNDGSEVQWWSAFAEVYDDLSRNFTPQQTVAFQIATDTILVGFGCPSWSVARKGLQAAARVAAADAGLA
jgi:C-terminal processing protease CtpA/Prc